MDLIYMNEALEDIGVLQRCEIDLAFGSDENDFTCTVNDADHCCQAGFYIYAEGTEYGGIIDGLRVDTDKKEVTYIGRTWHGILGGKVIVPLQSGEASTETVTVKTQTDSGEPLLDRYLTISGDANACIGFILGRVGLSDLFRASATAAGVNINAYQFDRYTDAYSGLVKMLKGAGLKLEVSYKGGFVELSAAAIVDYSQAEDFDSDLIDFQAEKKSKTVNHLICLGKGDLEDRTVIHLYADESGNVSDTQTLFGLAEIVDVYDFSSVESPDELAAKGKEQLQKLWATDSMKVNFSADDDTFDVGDIVGATDNITGLSVSAAIAKKIVKISSGQISISYEVGE